MAQSQSGLGDPDLIGKFSRAKATLNQFDSMEQMQAQMPQPAPPVIPQNQGQGMPNQPLSPLGEPPVPPTDESGLNEPPMM